MALTEGKVLLMAKQHGHVRWRLYFALAFLLALWSPFALADSTKIVDVPKTLDLAAIDAYVAAQAHDKGYAGLALTIVRDGKIVLAKGYGKRLLETGAAVEPETRFAIGSVTKQFTCACILLLAEDGKLSINDKVAQYEPKLTRAGDITLYDLMTHLSGYPDYYPLDFVDRRLLKPILIGRSWRSMPAASLILSQASAGHIVIRGTRFLVMSSPRSVANRLGSSSRSGFLIQWG